MNERKLADGAKLMRKLLKASAELVHATEAAGKWDGGTTAHKKALVRLEKANTAYDEVAARAKEWSDAI